MVYRTKGTCSQAINVEAENGIVTKVQFVGGCAGNTAGIAKLVVWHESGRRHQQTGRHHLRPAPDLMSGSAGKSSEAAEI